jgi:ubiquinone/menaquinone biosynthesis C-methylase UbiE
MSEAREANGSIRVDYERSARRYDRGRSLDDATVARWRNAVSAVLPRGPVRRILDVGAGTGLWFDMWRNLGAREIVAIEPSTAMRERARARLRDGDALYPATAEDLPLADGSVDVAWLSTVVHHFADPGAATAELARVVRPGGAVLVRGFFRGHSRIPWADIVAGHARAEAGFPSVDELRDVFADACLRVTDVALVDDAMRRTAAEVAEWYALMRSSDSMLAALTPDEIDAAIASLRARGDHRFEPIALTLIVATRV